MIDKSGIYNLSNEDYHKDLCPVPSLSRSTIKNLLFECPAKAWWEHPRLNPDFVADDGDGKFDIGTSAHSLLLEGLDNAVVVEADDWRKKEAKEQRDNARAEGKVPLLTKQYGRVEDMVEIAKKALKQSELGIGNLLFEGDSELSYIWKEGETWLRCRPDWISKDRKIKLSYKTTDTSVNPDNLAKHILNMGYDIQHSLYKRGIKAIEGIEPKTVFLFQECTPPHLCSFISLPPAFQELGTQKVIQGIKLWRHCMETGDWYGYPNRIAYPDLPSWAMAAWEEKRFALDVSTGEGEF